MFIIRKSVKSIFRAEPQPAFCDNMYESQLVCEARQNIIYFRRLFYAKAQKQLRVFTETDPELQLFNFYTRQPLFVSKLL